MVVLPPGFARWNVAALTVLEREPEMAKHVQKLGKICAWALQPNENRVTRPAALMLLGGAGLCFIYLYPHLAAVEVLSWLDQYYYWCERWR